MIRKGMCFLLALCLVWTLAVPAEAEVTADVEGYAELLIRYYRYYQDGAEDVIWDILRQMEEVDPNQAAVWENLMEDWAWINSGMPVGENVLPDGLPEDDSLCIVVLGYGLNDDGSMKEELVDRLVVALTAALKYPNAWIAVTGGQTSPVEGVTEAGQMAAWLQKKGVDSRRILQEKQSLSTTANAVNVYKLLNASYPQVDSVAVITSDYHLTWGSAMFAAVSNYRFGYQAGNPIDVVAGAACTTGGTFDSMASQAWGVAAITGVPFDENAPAPALYPVDRPTEPETQPTEASPVETEPEHPFSWEDSREKPADAAEPETEEKRSFLPLVLAAGLALGVYLLIPKRPGKRKRREKPKMDWS